ncbi:hypothetical protein Dimus_020998 [Dionaea muscipula]
MHINACKESYANLTLFHYKKKEVVRSSVRGVEIEFDSMRLASILGVPRNNGICEYIKEVWEESKYIKPLEITRKFANDELINEARRVKPTEMKPFQRFLHFVVMKNVVPRFGKRDTTNFMDLTYMDHLSMRRLLTMVFEAFDVPLIDKQGEEPKRYDFFKETFLTMCQLKRENGVWWLATGEHRRRDDEINAPAAEEGQNQEDFDREAVIDEVEIQEEEVAKEAEIQEGSGSNDKFYDAQVDLEAPADDVPAALAFPASPADSSTVQKEKALAGVDPSAPTGSILDSVFNSLQAEFERARANRIQAELDRAQAENARLLALLQQAQS